MLCDRKLFTAKSLSQRKIVTSSAAFTQFVCHTLFPGINSSRVCFFKLWSSNSPNFYRSPRHQADLFVKFVCFVASTISFVFFNNLVYFNNPTFNNSATFLYFSLNNLASKKFTASQVYSDLKVSGVSGNCPTVYPDQTAVSLLANCVCNKFFRLNFLNEKWNF